MTLAALLSKDAVLPRLDAISKKQALKMLAVQAEKLTGLDNADIFSVMMEREQAGCTGVGEGISIPHGRFEHLDKIHALFATLSRPVEFGSADGKPVDVVFMLMTPSSANTEHLKAMAVVSRLLRDKALMRTLRDTTDAEKMHTLLTTGSKAA